MEKGGDTTNLINVIRRVNLQIETNTSVYEALDKAKAIYYTYRQGDEESSAKQLSNFKSIIETVKHLGGTNFTDNTLINCVKIEDNNKGEQRKSNNEYTQIVRYKMMEFVLTKHTKSKLTKSLTSIRNQHSFNFEVHPKNRHGAYELLENHSSSTHQTRQHDGNGRHRGRGTDRGHNR